MFDKAAASVARMWVARSSRLSVVLSVVVLVASPQLSPPGGVASWRSSYSDMRRRLFGLLSMSTTSFVSIDDSI